MNNHLLQKVEDSIAPLSFIKANGYYTVGDKIFNYKRSAMVHATKTKQKINWIFHNNEFERLNWRQQSNVDIRTLYLARAKQLREKYNYLILCWSGGADSDTVLDTFLYNNIHLDELVIYWPLSRTKGKYCPTTNVDPANFVSEWDFVIQPKLTIVQQQFPKLKITILDLHSDDNLKITPYHESDMLESLYPNYFQIERKRMLNNLIKDRINQHNCVGTIYGFSPIEVFLIDNWLAVQFSDIAFSASHKTDYINGGWPMSIEYFYWTPELPNLVRDQAHILLRYYDHNPSCLKYINCYSLTSTGLKIRVAPSSADQETHRKIRKSLIYPDFNQTTFQTAKPHDGRNTTFPGAFSWFWNHPETTRFIDPWRDAMKSYHSQIDKQFLQNDNGFGHTPITTRPYPVGKLSDQAYEKFNILMNRQHNNFLYK